MKIWSALLSICIGVLAVIGISSFLHSPAKGQHPASSAPPPARQSAGLPECGNAGLLDDINNVLDGNTALKLLDVNNPFELNYDEDNLSRDCAASGVFNSGNREVYYRYFAKSSDRTSFILQVNALEPGFKLRRPDSDLSSQNPGSFEGLWSRSIPISDTQNMETKLRLRRDHAELSSNYAVVVLGRKSPAPAKSCRVLQYQPTIVLAYCKASGEDYDLDCRDADNESCQLVHTYEYRGDSDTLKERDNTGLVSATFKKLCVCDGQ